MIYSLEFKFCFVVMLAATLLFLCCGCVPNAERVRFQIPALLDLDIELNPKASANNPAALDGKQPPALRELFEE